MNVRQRLLEGIAIPAHPLALTAGRKLDERRQRALTRYYVASGAGGIAVGVHTTQFEIRSPEHALLQPVLELASQTVDETMAGRAAPFVKVAGICGRTEQAMSEAETAASMGYHAGLLSLAAWNDVPEDALIAHCRTMADAIPLFGFYLQPAVGGRALSYSFWREFAEISNVVAIKIAPFNRYQTLDVVRAVVESGRDDIALYTGNDDSIIVDLLTPFVFSQGGEPRQRRIAGGLLGQWAVWTHCAAGMLANLKRADAPVLTHWLTHAAALTDANAAVFDAANGFRGCIPGIHEILRRQGLLAGTWCLNPTEVLSPGQSHEIDRVCAAYPWLADDAFVAEHRDCWLS